MKILVTGGAGFIGSNLIRYWIQNTSDELLNLDSLTYAGNLDSLTDVATNSRYRFVRANICDSAQVQSIFNEFNPDAVMHLAAESHVDRSIDAPGEFIQTNLIGTFNLLQSARSHFQGLDADRKKHFRFLHVSTDEVYGSLQVNDDPFTEKTAYDPHSPYSASKAGSDHLARAWYDTFGLPVVVTNCSNNYGPYQFPEKLVPFVILRALQGKTIPVYGTGQNIRDWLHVTDHARALNRVLTAGQPGQTYNIGGNNELRNIDLVETLCQLMDELLPCGLNGNFAKNAPRIASYRELITFVADRPGHDLRYAIDISKIKQELGWEPQQDARTGFRQTVQWYLDHVDWWQRILSGDYKLERQGTGLVASSKSGAKS